MHIQYAPLIVVDDEVVCTKKNFQRKKVFDGKSFEKVRTKYSFNCD
jgi:hypothetical protein